MAQNTVVHYDTQNQQAQVEVPLNPRRTPAHWQEVFRRYDLDNDGRISLMELRAMILSESYQNDIPEPTVRRIMQKADDDHNGYLDMDEFERLVATKEFKHLMGHMMNVIVKSIVVPRRTEYDGVDGVLGYDAEYNCNPPTLFMIIISLLEVITYIFDKYSAEAPGKFGSATILFMYDPNKRTEVWRFIMYMLVHDGVDHIVGNLVVQILLGIPLEMVHKWWRVLLIYFAGVLAGSLGTSVTDPDIKLVGASGGVYALLTAHIASILMNWSEMRFAPLQLVVMCIWIVCDVTTAVFRRYSPVAGDKIAYAAHLSGALAGLLVGINVLRNLRVRKWENVLWWIAIFVYCVFESSHLIYRNLLSLQVY